MNRATQGRAFGLPLAVTPFVIALIVGYLSLSAFASRMSPPNGPWGAPGGGPVAAAGVGLSAPLR